MFVMRSVLLFFLSFPVFSSEFICSPNGLDNQYPLIILKPDQNKESRYREFREDEETFHRTKTILPQRLGSVVIYSLKRLGYLQLRTSSNRNLEIGRTYQAHFFSLWGEKKQVIFCTKTL